MPTETKEFDPAIFDLQRKSDAAFEAMTAICIDRHGRNIPGARETQPYLDARQKFIDIENELETHLVKLSREDRHYVCDLYEATKHHEN